MQTNSNNNSLVKRVKLDIQISKNDYEIYPLFDNVLRNNNDKIENLINHSSKIIGLEVDLKVLKSQHALQKTEYDSKINDLHNELKHKAVTERVKTNEATRIGQELNRLKEELKKLKKESKYQLTMRDERLKAFQTIEKSNKSKLEEERSQLLSNIATLEKTVKRLSTDIEIKTKEIQTDRETIRKLTELNNHSSTTSSNDEILEKYQLMIEENQRLKDQLLANSVSTQNMTPPNHYYETVTNLEAENLELKRANNVLNEISTKNYLIVNENENLRQQLKTYTNLYQMEYPQLQSKCERLERELQNWAQVAHKFSNESSVKGNVKSQNTSTTNFSDSDNNNNNNNRDDEAGNTNEDITPQRFAFWVRELITKQELQAGDQSRLQTRLNNLLLKYQADEKQLQAANLNNEIAKLSQKNLLSTLKYFRDNLAKLRPKCEKLQNYLEYRSIIPRGHSEYENFKDTFLIIDNMINLPISMEEKEHKEQQIMAGKLKHLFQNIKE